MHDVIYMYAVVYESRVLVRYSTPPTVITNLVMRRDSTRLISGMFNWPSVDSSVEVAVELHVGVLECGRSRAVMIVVNVVRMARRL